MDHNEVWVRRVMPGFNLPRTPYHLFVNNSIRFFRHCRWLLATAYVFTLFMSNVWFLVRAFGDGPGQSHMETMWRWYGNCAVSTEIVRSLYGFPTVCAEMVPWLCNHHIVRAFVYQLCIPKGGKEKKVLEGHKTAPGSWCGRSGIAARYLLYSHAILWALHGYHAATLQ